MNEFFLKKDDNKDKYDLKPLDNLDFLKKDENEAKREYLLKFIKKISLCSNNSFYHQCVINAKETLIETMIKNSLFFIITQILCIIITYFWKDSKELQYFIDTNFDISLKYIMGRIIFFTIPELFVFFFFRVPRLYYKNKSVLNRMRFVYEKYQYAFNTMKNNNLFCKEINNNFDLHFIVKNKHMKKQYNTSYKIPISILGQNVFYEHAIIYSTKSLYKLCNNYCATAEFIIIITIETHFIKEDLYALKERLKNFDSTYLSSVLQHYLGILSMKICSKYLIMIKIIVLISDFFFDLFFLEKKRKNNLEKIKKSINDNIINNGYFLDMNNDICIIYKLKEKYQSLKYDYKYFCKESNKLMNL